MLAPLIIAATSIISALWCVMLMENLLAILVDTSYGNDEVESWPKATFLNWHRESLSLVLACAYSILPGLGIIAIIRLPDSIFFGYWLIAFFSLFLLFPFVLLSMLDGETILLPLSSRVTKSVSLHFKTWLSFYFLSGVLAITFGGLFQVLLSYAFCYVFSYVIILISSIVSSFVLVTVLMIYFRLLGRLAWCCSFDSPQEIPRPSSPVTSDPSTSSRQLDGNVNRQPQDD